MYLVWLHTHTHIHTYTQTHKHTHTHAGTQTHKHTHTRARTHAPTPTVYLFVMLSCSPAYSAGRLCKQTKQRTWSEATGYVFGNCTQYNIGVYTQTRKVNAGTCLCLTKWAMLGYRRSSDRLDRIKEADNNRIHELGWAVRLWKNECQTMWTYQHQPIDKMTHK